MEIASEALNGVLTKWRNDTKIQINLLESLGFFLFSLKSNKPLAIGNNNY